IWLLQLLPVHTMSIFIDILIFPHFNPKINNLDIGVIKYHGLNLCLYQHVLYTGPQSIILLKDQNFFYL
ncbi:MAG TPA: hypothetical protein DCX89_04235, partial [Saprospirales bacterium]|nr:hypothetical protein [Saprospirales bacterium]